MLAMASCRAAACSAVRMPCASGWQFTAMVNTAWRRAGSGMKVWRSVRHQARPAKDSALTSSGQRCGSTCRGCACRRGWPVTFQTKRSQRSAPVTRATRASDARTISALSATGACTSANGRPTLDAGSQCEGRATASQGMLASLASTIAKSSANARLSRPARRHSGGSGRRQRAISSPRPKAPVAVCSTTLPATAVPSCSALARWPSQAQARGVLGGGVRGQRVQRGCRVETRAHLQRQRPEGARAPPAFRAGGASPAPAGVSWGVPGASRRRPGCMRKGALTAASKSKLMRVMLSCAAPAPCATLRGHCRTALRRSVHRSRPRSRNSRWPAPGRRTRWP